MKGYADLTDMPEEDRITTIGKAAMAGNVVAFCVDDEPADKVTRYVKKLLERFPDLEEMDRFKGPAKGVVTVKVRKKVRGMG
jgi:hypothetical protein